MTMEIRLLLHEQLAIPAKILIRLCLNSELII
jgi:hypothetical protein